MTALTKCSISLCAGWPRWDELMPARPRILLSGLGKHDIETGCSHDGSRSRCRQLLRHCFEGHLEGLACPALKGCIWAAIGLTDQRMLLSQGLVSTTGRKGQTKRQYQGRRVGTCQATQTVTGRSRTDAGVSVWCPQRRTAARIVSNLCTDSGGICVAVTVSHARPWRQETATSSGQPARFPSEVTIPHAPALAVAYHCCLIDFSFFTCKLELKRLLEGLDAEER